MQIEKHNAGSVVAIVNSAFAQQRSIADPPEVRDPFTLTAIYDSAAEHNAFAFDGKTVPPLIRVSPGGVIKLHYVNSLPEKSDEQCALGRCMNMSNLHFHGRMSRHGVHRTMCLP